MGTFNQRSRFVTWMVVGCLIACTFITATAANAQELITNGNFSDGLTNWTQASWAGGSSFGINANGPTDTSAASGNYAYAGGGTYNLLTQDVNVTSGSAYRLSFLAGSKSGQGTAYGLLSLRQEALNNYNAASFDYLPSDAAFGSYTVDFVADATTVGVWLRSDAGTYAAYDNVSVTPIASVANALNYSSASGYTEITSALTGSGKVTSNAGTGGLTLKAANSYTGGTEVTGGNLYVTGVGTLGAAGGTVTVSGAGQLDLRNQQIRTGTIAMVGQDARIISGDVNNPGSLVNNGVALQFGGGLISLPVSGSAGFNVTGGGSITGSNSYAGPTTISATPGWYGTNTFFVSNANALGAASADLTISGGIVSLQGNTVTRTGNVIISGGQVHTGTFTKSSGVYDIQGGQVDVVLAGAAGLTKSGTSTAALAGSSTYTGATTVSLGKLLVNGDNSSATGAVTVAAGATLCGSGVIGGATTVNGTLSPGNSPGVLSIASLVLGGSSTSLFEIAGTARGAAYDGVTITQSSGLTYGGALALTLSGTFGDNTTFDLFNFAGASSGNFASVTASGLYGSLTFTNDGSGVWTSGPTTVVGQTMTFTQATGDLVIVPEPGALALAGLGVAAAWIVRRRRS